MSFLKLAVIAHLLGGVCLTAQAGSWYAVGAFGASYANSDYHDLVSAVNNTHNSNTSNHEHPWSFTGKLGGGYQINDYFGLEANFYWIGAHKHDHAGDGGSVRNSSHAEFKSWGLGVDAVGYWPINHSVRLYGKAGLALLRQSAENTASEPQYDFSDHDTRLAPKLAIGSEYSLSECVALRLEYEHIFNAAKTIETSSGAITSAQTDYDMIVIGIRYSF